MGVTERNDIVRNKSCVWVCCKCRENNYCDSLFCDFGIPLGVNMYEIIMCTHDEDNVNQACDICMSTDKEKERIDNSLEPHRFEVNCSNETNKSYVTKNKVPIKKQIGGYFLRSKATKQPAKTAKDNTRKKERTGCAMSKEFECLNSVQQPSPNCTEQKRGQCLLMKS